MVLSAEFTPRGGGGRGGGGRGGGGGGRGGFGGGGRGGVGGKLEPENTRKHFYDAHRAYHSH